MLHSMSPVVARNVSAESTWLRPQLRVLRTRPFVGCSSAHPERKSLEFPVRTSPSELSLVHYLQTAGPEITLEDRRSIELELKRFLIANVLSSFRSIA